MIPVNDLLLMLEIGRIKVTVVNGFPDEIEGFTVATSKKPGYFDIWLSNSLTADSMQEIFLHELWHIANDDLHRADVQEIERDAHRAQDNNFYRFFDGVNWAEYLRTAKVISMKERCDV